MIKMMVNQTIRAVSQLEWVKNCHSQIDEEEGEIIITIDYDEEHYILEKLITGGVNLKNILYFSWQLQYNIRLILNGQEYSLTEEEREKYIEKLMKK